MSSELLIDHELTFARAIARLNATNPFLPERITYERDALGEDYEETGAPWNTQPPTGRRVSNHGRIYERCENIISRVRAAWPTEKPPSAATRGLYVELFGFWLYQRYAYHFDEVILRTQSAKGVETERVQPDFYRPFRDDVVTFLDLPGLGIEGPLAPPHLFACAYQIRRAFHHVFHSLVGGSAPMAQLRAAIWQSIFTHDLGRYRRVLFAHMGDFATLITGPSGTGKELVARAIAWSRYMPYEPRKGGFALGYTESFFPLNLSALSPTLIESELFGHRRGAFTGAMVDRVGWMEQCPAEGSVFLDEIGDVDASIQVKLLRVLQARTFQRLGDTENRRFGGKIIAATHQDLPEAIAQGQFREDFYYRLCSDLVRTPSLREQLDDRPEDLGTMVDIIAGQLVGQEEREAFAAEAQKWILRHLGAAYAWPGNFRELEQCMRNLLVRGDYRSTGLKPARADWLEQAARGELSAEALLAHYTRHVHQRSATLEETAQRLGVNWRTVRSRLKPTG